MEDDMTLFDQSLFVRFTQAELRIENVAIQSDDFLFECRIARTYRIEQLQIASLFRIDSIELTALANNCFNRSSHDCDRFGRMRRKICRIPGHDRSSFSTNCLPMKPVAPVMKTDLSWKKLAMALVSTLADMII
jgi:hypothetical protein